MPLKYRFCPNCSIGISNTEAELHFCRNCKHSWEWDDDECVDDDDFQCCDKCDRPDACADWGCAIESGIRKI